MLNKILSRLFIFLVRVYQYGLSPILPNACRYDPTCSHYMVQSIQEWGVWKGTWMGLKRIGRCHPWGGFGYDPVPKKPQDKSDKISA
jgi:putative membrane protein insertion efficiency factor